MQGSLSNLPWPVQSQATCVARIEGCVFMHRRNGSSGVEQGHPSGGDVPTAVENVVIAHPGRSTKSLGMRQVDLARELGWSQQKWGQWENGKRNPNVADMIELAERYGVTLDYIYRGDMSRLPEWMAKNIRELAASDPSCRSRSWIGPTRCG